MAGGIEAVQYLLETSESFFKNKINKKNHIVLFFWLLCLPLVGKHARHFAGKER